MKPVLIPSGVLSHQWHLGEKAVLHPAQQLDQVSRLLPLVHQVKETKDWEKGSKGLLCAASGVYTVNNPAHETNGITRITGVITTGGCDFKRR